MAEERTYFVYIITNQPHGTLYVGITNSLNRRIWQHKTGEYEGFSKQYGLKRLVHHEDFRDVRDAIAREKQIKGWTRTKKVTLIAELNPLWHDLSAGWYK